MEARSRRTSNCAAEDALRLVSLVSTMLSIEGSVLGQVYGSATHPSIPVLVSLMPLCLSAILNFSIGAPGRCVKRLRGLEVDNTLAPLSPFNVGCIGLSDLLMAIMHLGTGVYLLMTLSDALMLGADKTELLLRCWCALALFLNCIIHFAFALRTLVEGEYISGRLNPFSVDKESRTQTTND